MQIKYNPLNTSPLFHSFDKTNRVPMWYRIKHFEYQWKIVRFVIEHDGLYFGNEK